MASSSSGKNRAVVEYVDVGRGGAGGLGFCGAKTVARIVGEVAPGFEPVSDVFRKHFVQGLEEHAQVFAYVKGKLVVSLVGSLERVAEMPKPGSGKLSDILLNEQAYDASSIQNVFSSGKAMASVAMAMLVDRGRVKYETLLTDFWPEYGQHGKEGTTLAMVLRHEAGLRNLRRKVPLEELYPENIKRSGGLSKIIEESKPAHVPGEKRAYHAVTRGWILNEICKRVDEKGRTLGEFVREEIARPLGIDNELYVGLPLAAAPKCFDIKESPTGFVWRHLFLPKFLGGKIRAFFLWRMLLVVAFGPMKILEKLGVTSLASSNPFTLPEDFSKTLPTGFDVYNHPSVRRAEIPSANTNASARALGMVAAAVANGGVAPNGYRLLSENAIGEMHANPVVRRLMLSKATFVNAGVNHFKLPHGIENRGGYYGWMGMGGSCMQWQLEHGIGFGYAMSLASVSPLNPRSKRLQLSVLECAKSGGNVSAKL